MNEPLQDMTRPRRRERHTTLADEGAYQVDLVVAFFAILLVLFVVYSARAYSEISEQSRLAYRLQDKKSRPFELKSFIPLFPFRDIWIVKDGEMTQISLSNIVKKISKKWKGSRVSTTINGADIIIRPMNESATDFFLKVYIIENGIPKWLSNSPTLNLKDNFEDIKNELSSSKRGLLVFIWEDQLENFQRIYGFLKSNGIPFSMHIIPRNKKSFAISLRRKDYGLENVLRPY